MSNCILWIANNRNPQHPTENSWCSPKIQQKLCPENASAWHSKGWCFEITRIDDINQQHWLVTPQWEGIRELHVNHVPKWQNTLGESYMRYTPMFKETHLLFQIQLRTRLFQPVTFMILGIPLFWPSPVTSNGIGRSSNSYIWRKSQSPYQL